MMHQDKQMESQQHDTDTGMTFKQLNMLHSTGFMLQLQYKYIAGLPYIALRIQFNVRVNAWCKKQGY